MWLMSNIPQQRVRSQTVGWLTLTPVEYLLTLDSEFTFSGNIIWLAPIFSEPQNISFKSGFTTERWKGGGWRGKKQQIASTDWRPNWRQRHRATWKWVQKASGRDCVGGREVEKLWRVWRTQEGNCRPLGRAMHERGLCRGPGKVTANTKGGVQRYMSNQRKIWDEGRRECELLSRVASEWMMRIHSEQSMHKPHPKLPAIYYCVASRTFASWEALSLSINSCRFQTPLTTASNSSTVLYSRSQHSPNSALLFPHNSLMIPWTEEVCRGSLLFEPYAFLAGIGKEAIYFHLQRTENTGKLKINWG